MTGPAISDRCLIGAISISIAATNAANAPTEVPPELLCQSAVTITADSAQAESTCVIGVIVALATTALIERRRSDSLTLRKRLACVPAAPCSRTMRQASTFSSTT